MSKQRINLEKKGFEPYDMARSKEQAEEIAKGVKTAYRLVKILPTTNEANKEEFPFIIYVDNNSIRA